MAQMIVLALEAYFATGLVFGLWFVARGVNRRDPAAAKAGAGFRLAILPGTAALWPVLLIRTRTRA